MLLTQVRATPTVCRRWRGWASLQLQEDIAETARVLVRKGRDLLEGNPGSEPTGFKDENKRLLCPQRLRECPSV
jgi:hypothetical protein